MSNELDPIFAQLLVKAKLPMPMTEYQFHPDRKWRFDYAWVAELVALEQEGGVWSGGRHTRGSGFLRDMEKYNAAATLGWRVVRCTPRTLYADETIDMLAAIFRDPDLYRREGRPMSLKELAAIGGLTRQTAMRWVSRDGLPTIPSWKSRDRHVSRPDLRRWLDHTTALAPEVRDRLVAWLDSQAPAPATGGGE